MFFTNNTWYVTSDWEYFISNPPPPTPMGVYMQSITQDYPWKKVRSCPFTPGWRNTAQHSTDSTAQTAQHRQRITVTLD